MEDRIEHRLQNSIGFIRTMMNFAKKEENMQIEIDFDNLKILLDLLEDCKDRFSR